MVSEATQSFIFSVVDANQEYNTKLVLLFLWFAYSALMLWLSNFLYPFFLDEKIKDNISLPIKWTGILLRVFALPVLVMFPLMFGIFSYRTLGLDYVLTLMITFYRFAFVMSLGVFFLFGMNWTINFLKKSGINFKTSRGRVIRRKTDE